MIGRKRGGEKRGGGAPVLALDCGEAEQRCVFDATGDESPDWIFDRHWPINLLQCTTDRLEADYAGRQQAELFAALEPALGKGGGRLALPGHRRAAGDERERGESSRAPAPQRKRFRRTLKEEIALTLGDESREGVEEEIRFLSGVFAH